MLKEPDDQEQPTERMIAELQLEVQELRREIWDLKLAVVEGKKIQHQTVSEHSKEFMNPEIHEDEDEINNCYDDVYFCSPPPKYVGQLKCFDKETVDLWHKWFREVLNLGDDAPYSFDYYVEQCRKLVNSVEEVKKKLDKMSSNGR